MKFYDWNSTIGSSLPAKAGIYVLLVKKQVPKVYKKDPKGILYIGQTLNLSKRLKVGKHKEWNKYYEKIDNSLMFNHSAFTFILDIDQKLNLHPHKYSIGGGGILKEKDKLYIQYAVTQKYEELEKQLLIGHIILYGQLPPFNNKGPTLKYIWNEMSEHKWEKAIKDYENVVDKLQI